jgi:hypothetical protein
VLTPLIIGVATGKIEYGSYAALGALPAGFVSFRGVSRTRVLAVLCAAVGMAISTFVGATTADALPWLLVPIVFAWAYLSGVLASLGPTVLAVTLQWPVALLIASALPLSPAPAALRAGLVLAGGLWQCLLVVTSWTINRGSAERTALATTLTGLARYAAEVATGRQAPPSPVQLTATYVLGDPNPLIRTAARRDLLDLVEEAERIRATLAALSIGRSGDGPGPDGRRVLQGTARVLTDLAAAVSGRPGQRAESLEAARRELDGISAETGTRWEWAGEALLGQLRSAARITERLNATEPGTARLSAPKPIRRTWNRDALLTVRASIGTSSEAGRHAVRLAVVSAAAEVIAQGSGLSHGYWIVLTIFIVLRPDYSSTLYRGLQRAAGTVVGAGLGVATVQLAKVSLTALLVGIGISLLAAYAVFTVNYLLYAVFLTDFVEVLLALLGLPPEPTALARLVGTAIGTGLAILAYLIWPTWEGTSAAEKFARLFAAQGEYARALLRAYSRPDGAEPVRLGTLQLAARRARIDAEASADRLGDEPDRSPMSASLARALTSAGHRIAQACLTLGAAVAAHRPARSPGDDADLQAGLDALAAGVATATGHIAAVLRSAGSAGQPDAPGTASAAASNPTTHQPATDQPAASHQQANEQPATPDLANGDLSTADTATADAAAAGSGTLPAGPRLPSLPPLRALQQAIWVQPAGECEAIMGTGATATTADESGAPDEAGLAALAAERAETGPPVGPSRLEGAAAGLFTATDGLVDAINTAAHALGD